MFVRCHTIACWLPVLACCLLALGGAARAAERGAAANDPGREHVRHLESLLEAGRFQEFADAAIRAASSDPQPAGLPRLQIEALLAVGRNHEAETLALRQLLAAAARSASARDVKTAPLDASLLRLWLTARWRQARGPEEPALDARLVQPDGTGSTIGAALAFWRETLSNQTPYRLTSGARRSVLPMAGEAIAMEVNGARLSHVFVDTGAQHTLLTPAAAAVAGVEVGPACAQMIGFSNFSARPGIVRRLRLGELVLKDVPVYVGESPALTQAGGQASLGIDLLYHLRVVMDYPRRQVIVEPAAGAGSREPVAQPAAAGWEIPLWTFSQTCLAQGRMPDGEYARTLIDTGNRHGTYLSTHWASRRVPDFQPLKNWFAHRYHLGKFTVADWQLGDLSLANWPVRGTLPADLERLNVVDVLIGHDLLARYRVEIDLPGRRLTLNEPDESF
jgi:hypothetical protein